MCKKRFGTFVVVEHYQKLFLKVLPRQAAVGKFYNEKIKRPENIRVTRFGRFIGLRQVLKSLAAITLPKSPIFLGNFW